MEEMKRVISQIEMPGEMEQRILEKCRQEGKRGVRRQGRIRAVTAAAALVLGILMMGGSALALSGRLEGFFRDVKRWDGAVVGTIYEQADDEVKLEGTDTGEGLELKLTLLYPEKAPYRYFESFGIKKYTITDQNGNTAAEADSLQLWPLTEEAVKVMIPFDGDNQGDFTLIVTELAGHSKAEQPLPLKGYWSFEFTR